MGRRCVILCQINGHWRICPVACELGPLCYGLLQLMRSLVTCTLSVRAHPSGLSALFACSRARTSGSGEQHLAFQAHTRLRWQGAGGVNVKR